MRARARVVAEADGAGGTRLAVLRSDPPLVLRAAFDGVYLVGGAAGPLGGDDLGLTVEVGDGADLVVRSAASSVALPGPGGRRSTFAVHASVAHNGRLRWLPHAGVAAAACDHRMEGRIVLEPAAELVWRDEVVLGRHREHPGRWTSGLRVEVGGVPLLHQELSVGDGRRPGWDGPAVTGGARALGSVVVAGPRWAAAPSAPLCERAAVLDLAGPGVQVVAAADDAVCLRRLLDAGLAAIGHPGVASVGPSSDHERAGSRQRRPG